jgi:hypothetical protein
MAPQDQSVDTSNTDPPEVTVGERLFLETRFAQFFKAFLDNGGKTNSPLPVGDPVVDTTVTTGQPLPGPFAGQSMNCRACHLVDEQLATPGGGMRTYADFARRSPVPARSDGKTTTVRNSPAMVNATLPRPNGILLHFDAEFASLTDLIIGTYTGRNLGWLPTEAPAAIAHMARIIREDDGKGSLAKKYSSLPFSILLTGTDPSIPDELRIPESFRINVATATDQEIFEAVARLVAAYVESLVFSQDDAGNFNGSPFDVFLSVNGFPRRAGLQEAPIDFSRRLLQQVKAREQAGTLSFVNSNPQTPDGKFQFHNQPFVFGTTELQGLKIFFGEAPPGPLSPGTLSQGGIGNCLACHSAPLFTDFNFHNTGSAQTEYDALHGAGAFLALSIPDLATRNASPDQYLPATAQHPNAKEQFRSLPSTSDPTLTDLGIWNVFANPDIPTPQAHLRATLCTDVSVNCSSDTVILPQAIARFKTPGLRDLGHSAPYMHTGQFDTLELVIGLYQTNSNLARAGTLRNGAPELQRIALVSGDVAPLSAFLRSLNEDYN